MAMQPESVRVLHQSFPSPFVDDEEDVFERREALAILSISGPLMQRGGWFWDGYESIRERFERAMHDPTVGAVAIVINSPGGVCSGCFEAAAAMRRMKEATGKRVFAFADEMAYSAGYAMACVADEIYLPKPGGVGSVGVIGVLFDEVKFNESLGFNVVVVSSGEQKADGHPDAPLTEEAVARYRTRTTELAEIFADLVAEARSMTAGDVLALEAACVYGRAAVTARLADGVKTRDQFFAYAEREARKALPQNAANRRKAMAPKNIETAAAGGENAGETLLVSPPNASAVALALGLSHTADEARIIARATALHDFEREAFRLTGKASVDEALGAMQAGTIAVGQVETMTAELVTLKVDLSKREVDALIDAGKRDGKITTEAFEGEMRVLGAENPARLRAVLSTLPVLVTTGGPAPEPSATITLTEDELRVARQLGITPEQLMKSKAAQSAVKGAE